MVHFYIPDWYMIHGFQCGDHTTFALNRLGLCDLNAKKENRCPLTQHFRI
jgi:hypothetical protein